MSPFFKGLIHLFVSAAATTATVHFTSGAPITSGTVLIPALVAGALAVGHAMAPSIIPEQLPPSQPNANFPSTK